MSTEANELNQPNGGSDSGEPRQRFGFLHADTGVDEDGVKRDVNTSTVPASTVPASTVPASTVPGSTVVNDTVPASDAVPASEATAPPVAAFNANAPLLGDSVTLKANWQQAAAEFVDDPRAAVAEAAELVEHTAQTLVGALQQRQRQLRGQWENGTAIGVTGSNGATSQDGDTVNTEELRHLMQSYRALFIQLCAL